MISKHFLLLTLCLASQAAAPSVLRGGGSAVTPYNCSTGTANQQAACNTAANASACSAATLGDYYAEIGNASGPLWSHQNGGSVNRYVLTQLDSFTKFADGAYWVQVRNGVNNLTADDVMHLHQQSGYNNQPSNCPSGSTVLSCAATVPGVNNIISLGSITNGGSGYPSGLHKSNLTGGTGSGATSDLTIGVGGSVTNVALLATGTGYLVGDVLSSVLSGGSGLAVPVTDTTCYPATGYTIGSTPIASNSYGGLCTNNQGLFFYNGANFQTQAIIDGTSDFYNRNVTSLPDTYNTEFGTPTFTAATTNGSATFTNTGNNGLATGMHVYLGGNIPGNFSSYLASGHLYYVTNVTASPTATSFQLAATKCTPTTNGGWTSCNPAVVASSTTTGVTVTVMPLTFSTPLLAGGGNWSAGGMAVFLENILNGSLLFGGAFGAYEVTPNFLGNGEPAGGTDGTYCAYSGYPAQVLHGTVYGSPLAATTVTCGVGGTTINPIGYVTAPNGPWIINGISQALASPIKQNFKYGIAHWVISDPVVNGDGSFAGIGSKGVDGWIDPTKTYYGMLVRTGPAGSGSKSNQCDNLLRYAYLNATQISGPYPP